MPGKILIVYRVDKNDPSNAGVVSKLLGQLKGFSKAGYQVNYIIYANRTVYLNSERLSEISSSFGHRISQLSFYKRLLKVDLDGYDLYFIRFGLSTKAFIKWLHKIRKSNPQSKIVLDIPTYPYAKEWEGLIGKIVLAMDSYYSKQLKQIVSRVTHSGDHSSIFNIQTIKFSNGIDLENIPVKIHKNLPGYHFLAIGKWRFWHGLDRLLNGLGNYMEKGGDDVFLTVLGEGEQLVEYKKIVSRRGLESFVNFDGIKLNEQLNRYFDSADLGIGTLGLHRKGVYLDASLKHREYTARGLPFIMNNNDVDIPKEENFVFSVPPDESIIDVEQLKTFISGHNYAHIARQMRLFAERNLSWEIKIQQLVSKLWNENT